ncbi:hypothetical protein KP509_35G064700 [Ceratopteris richardii]|uniref:Uncharacterized protein n=1 Tax=Ceratopteris richardii TaxID=49495 RepID=A0A8T2QHF2_CERRI|nr:hypothetical protein KP509_35G064700 [Ceratopteris richardii]
MSSVIAKTYKRKLRTSPFLRFGLPLISLTVVGFLGLGHMVQGRRDVSNVIDENGWERLTETQGLTREGALGKNLQRKSKKINLEEELKAMQEKLDINSFEYKKIPKPGAEK